MFRLTKRVLTVLHLSNDWIRVQWFANTILVDSRDSELVLIALDEVGGVEGAGLTLGCYGGPGDPGCLPLLYHVVSDASTAVILWWVPPHCALLSSYAGEANRSLYGPWGVWRYKKKAFFNSGMYEY